MICITRPNLIQNRNYGVISILIGSLFQNFTFMESYTTIFFVKVNQIHPEGIGKAKFKWTIKNSNVTIKTAGIKPSSLSQQQLIAFQFLSLKTIHISDEVNYI